MYIPIIVSTCPVQTTYYTGHFLIHINNLYMHIGQCAVFSVLLRRFCLSQLNTQKNLKLTATTNNCGELQNWL